MSEPNANLLKEKILDILTVSTIPVVLRNVLDIVEDEKATVQELERVIEHDQAIAAKVVGMANASYYCFSRKIGSIADAIIVLGFEMVKCIAVSVSIFRWIGSARNARMNELWAHSYKVALMSRLLAEKTSMCATEKAFIAGLCHDIGKTLFLQIYAERYMSELLKGDAGLAQREKAMFGASHADAGGWFATKYKFPEEIVDAILQHHDAGAFGKREWREDESKLPLIVYMANRLVIDGPGLSSEELTGPGAWPELKAVLGGQVAGINAVLQEALLELSAMTDEANEFYKVV